MILEMTTPFQLTYRLPPIPTQTGKCPLSLNLYRKGNQGILINVPRDQDKGRRRLEKCPLIYSNRFFSAEILN